MTTGNQQRGGWRKRASAWLPGLALAGLLGLLAILQYRWLGEVSEAERQRTAAALQGAAERTAADFDRELTRAFLYFQPFFSQPSAGELTAPREALAEKFHRWQSEAPFPELIREVFRVVPSSEGNSLQRLDPATGELVPAAWPAALAPLDKELTRGRGRSQGGPRRQPGPPPVPLDGRAPALVLPDPWPASRRSGSPEGFRGRSSNRFGFTILWLEVDQLRQRVLPELIRNHFSPFADLNLSLSVVAHPSGLEIYHQGAGEALSAGQGDVETGLFRLRELDEIRRIAAEVFPEARTRGSDGERSAFLPSLGEWRRRYSAFTRVQGSGAWHLVARHGAGSLEAAVARTRTRNLSLSLGILGILAASFALLLRSNRQARGLARKRLELVAGVTHELLTPLAALRSAGQNLADGVVSKPEQVRRYGTLVDSEGGRLTRLISQMLELAGIESGQKPFEPASLDVGVALEQALSDCRAALETRRIEVASDIPDDLPAVLADPESLRRALCNLIENAAKYGPEGGRVDLRAAAEGKSRVRVEVLDRGPGISPEDLPHVFEPFYRGREVVASKVQGSGLGLALVQRIMEASGGRISVKNRDGGGSAFALSIPVEPAAKLSS